MSVSKCFFLVTCILELSLAPRGHAEKTAQVVPVREKMTRAEDTASFWMNQTHPGGRAFKTIHGNTSAWDVRATDVKENKVTVAVKSKDPVRGALRKFASGVGVVTLGEKGQDDTFKIKSRQAGILPKVAARLTQNQNLMETVNSDYVKSAIAGALTYALASYGNFQIPPEQASLFIITAYNIAAGFNRTRKHEIQRDAIPEAIEAATRELFSNNPGLDGSVVSSRAAGLRSSVAKGKGPADLQADVTAAITNNVFAVLDLKTSGAKK